MKKKIGRPTERVQDRPLQMRVDDEFIDMIDDWRQQQSDFPNRTQAIRRLVALGIASQAIDGAKKRPRKRKAD
jgi:hypothetical protein